MKIALFILFYGLSAQVATVSAEIYKRVDAQGRTHFSDSSLTSYKSVGYQQVSTSSSKQNSDALEKVAKRLKKNRLKREGERKRSLSKRKQKHKKQLKLLAAANKRKKACSVARQKEDKAFRQRTQRQSLTKMRKALANYEKKRELRQVKCQ